MILNTIFIIIIGMFYYDTIKWLIISWMNNPYYSHGFIVPIISCYMIWNMREGLLNTEKKQSQYGLIFFLAGISLFGIGNIYTIRFLSGLSLILTIFGIILYLYGWKIINKVKFPILLLILAIPIPIIDIVVPPMQTIAALSSAKLANIINLPVHREGLYLHMPNGTFQVAAECSGINSVISLFTLSTIFAFILEVRLFKKFIIVLSSIPLAIIGNIIRIVSVLMIANIYGQRMAADYFHNFSSILLFIIPLLGLIIIGRSFGRLKFKKIF